MLHMTDAALSTLRAKHRELADVVEADRALEPMRSAGVIAMAAVKYRRACVRLAEGKWGHAIRSDGTALA